MGYYITLEDHQCTIPADKLEAAFEAMKALNHQPGIEKRGGSWSGGVEIERHFSWMEVDYDETCADAKEIFEMLGFDTMVNENGDLSLVGYDSKTGQEDLFLTAVAPYVNDGALIFRGEDGMHYEYQFVGGEFKSYLY